VAIIAPNLFIYKACILIQSNPMIWINRRSRKYLSDGDAQAQE